MGLYCIRYIIHTSLYAMQHLIFSTMYNISNSGGHSSAENWFEITVIK